MRCSIEGCDGVVLARSFCSTHYDRWRRHGDPNICLKKRQKNGTLMRWCLDHISHRGDECLLWPYGRHKDGRAMISKSWCSTGQSSRFMCELAHGAAPSSQHEAAHSCGNGYGGCVNPRHLRWATCAENKADMILHGTRMAGERHYRAKLTAENVRMIRAMKGHKSQREIAIHFGVSRGAVSGVISGVNWKDA